MPSRYQSIKTLLGRPWVGLTARLLAVALSAYVLCTGCAHLAPGPYNRDGAFDLAAYDSGNREGVCFIQAPWGPRSWTIEGSTFSDPSDHTLSACRFAARDGRAYLYGRNISETPKWGFVRYSQGAYAGGSNCGPVPGHNPKPMRAAGRNLRLNIDVYRDTSRLLADSKGWIMFAVNVWLTAEPEPDRAALKPLVLDLIFHHERSEGCPPTSFESKDAYHYQAFVGEAPDRAWQSFRIDLSRHIRDALAHPWQSGYLTTDGGRYMIRQLDFVVELVNAEGAATIDNFYLTVER